MDEGATALAGLTFIPGIVCCHNLADALTSCKSLAVLSLAENHVGDKGAIRFAETLE